MGKLRIDRPCLTDMEKQPTIGLGRPMARTLRLCVPLRYIDSVQLMLTVVTQKHYGLKGNGCLAPELIADIEV
jgi:hypothetical protein